MRYVAGEGGPVPLIDVPMMDDYEWQLSCLESRLRHPEAYTQLENVEETVAKLRQWLKEHDPKRAGKA